MISRQMGPCMCGDSECPSCGLTQGTLPDPEVCNDCGNQLVHVGGGGATGLLCPVCDADSALLDTDDYEPACRDVSDEVDFVFGCVPASSLIAQAIVADRIGQRIEAGVPCGICSACKSNRRCLFFPPDFIPLPPSRWEILRDKLAKLFAYWQDDAVFLMLLIIGLIAAMILGGDR